MPQRDRIIVSRGSFPTGNHFFFAAERRATGTRMNMLVGSLDSLGSAVIGEADSNAVFAEGNLLYLRQNTLLAQPFDLRKLATSGEAVPIADRIDHFLDPDL
jgi:hypothetical protein